MSDWADALCGVGGYVLKPDSLEVISSSVREHEESEMEVRGRRWLRKSHTVALGFTVSATGNTRFCRERFLRQVGGAFWANSKVLLNRTCPTDGRLRFWRSISKGIGDYRYGSWPIGPSAMRELDSKMNAYIERILGLRPTSDDTPATFCRRRNQATKEASRRLDLMSSRH